ncbi:MAG: hypothetical protein QM757_34085 [Paludibaculum sp.]
MTDYQARWAAKVMAEVKRHRRAVDRLFAVPHILARLAQQGEGPVGMSRLVDDLGREPELRDQVPESLRHWVRLTAEQFSEAQQEGSIRNDISAELLAEVAVGGFMGMQTMTRQLGDDALERRVKVLIDVVRRLTEKQTTTRRKSP